MFSFIKKSLREHSIRRTKKEILKPWSSSADGADINAKIDDTDGDTPLNCAAAVGQNEVAELLFTNGADVNTKDDFGWTTYHSAAMNSHIKIVKLLIANSIDLNTKDDKGATPLHDAAEEGYKELVELLIAKGADLNSVNENKNTPLDLLSSVELKVVTAKIAILLRKHGARRMKNWKLKGNETNFYDFAI